MILFFCPTAFGRAVAGFIARRPRLSDRPQLTKNRDVMDSDWRSSNRTSSLSVTATLTRLAQMAHFVANRCHTPDSPTVPGFRFTARFARTLRRDLEAVKLSMTTPWSNGPIEGQINRLKAIKPRMYGQACFGLLKARVLPWDASSAA